MDTDVCFHIHLLNICSCKIPDNVELERNRRMKQTLESSVQERVSTSKAVRSRLPNFSSFLISTCSLFF